MRRAYKWLAIQPQDRETPQLVREWVKCGKPSCRCRRGRGHGPYWYLRYEEWDAEAGAVRYRREYVPRGELRRVQRWIRRARAENWRWRSFLSSLRRCLPR